MKKIMNSPEHLVAEMCQGIEAAHPELKFQKKYKIIEKRNPDKKKVNLISGGGSGHEPAHAGFVGKGMLDAAVCGDVFASPSQIQVYQAIREMKSEKGVLLIVKNYSGDMMNFKNAAYMAKEDGILVDYVRVDDDIAVKDSLYTVGRRGVAGTIFVHKIAGAAAESGWELPEVKRVAQKTVENVRSIGFALSSCTVPAKGTPTFQLEEEEMEYGVGIHGEPGIQREQMRTADELAERMTEVLLRDLAVEEEDEIALLINGFGATPLQELYLFNGEVSKKLSQKKVRIVKSFVGNYMTSIDMAGASVSVLRLDEELKTLLFKDCDTPALKMHQEKPVKVEVPEWSDEISNKTAEEVVRVDEAYARVKDERLSFENIRFIVHKMSEIIIENETAFCELDSYAGDGDFGMSVAKGFRQLNREWKDLLLEGGKDIGAFLGACAMVIMEHCGGASGPVWGSAFRAAGKYAKGKETILLADLAGMMEAAVKGIQDTGERSFGRGARVGDKTLIDALVPCADTLCDGAAHGMDLEEAMKKGAAAAVEGARSTEKIVARMGRAGTVGERSLGYPDAGAHAVGVIFTELLRSLKFQQ